jgi:hypothetical protein
MTTALDMRNPYLPTGPSEWEPLDEATQRVLAGAGRILTPEQYAALQRVWGRRWFLLRNDGPLGRARCGRCNAFHAYITFLCQPRPFNGITEIIGLYEQQQARDLVLSAIALGTVTPISRKDAYRLYTAIRMRGGEL